MDNKLKVGLVIAALLAIFLFDYIDKSLCKGVAIPYKCKNYLEY